MRSASRLLSLVAALAALCGLSAQCFVPWQGRAPAVARAAQASKSKPFFKPRPPPIESSPPPKASQISMLDIIYVRKYLAGSQKELQKAINMFSHMDPYMKGRIPAFIEKTSLLNTRIKL
ncbi:unnamed protein product [Durusdinium trenchii]|uniref:Uncharacterized protein n=1 Tax=Durusdinium trenchii TaxID=1381693 RepID=A0ABP0JQA2_9DINO